MAPILPAHHPCSPLSLCCAQLDLKYNELGPEGAAALAPAIAVCASVTKVNLDNYWLPIKQLKGTEPVVSIDLSSQGLTVLSAVVIASLIQGNASLTKIS